MPDLSAIFAIDKCGRGTGSAAYIQIPVGHLCVPISLPRLHAFRCDEVKHGLGLRTEYHIVSRDRAHVIKEGWRTHLNQQAL